MYRIDNSEPQDWRKVLRYAQTKGYKDAQGPFFLAQWLKIKGHTLYEVVNGRDVEVGNS